MNNTQIFIASTCLIIFTYLCPLHTAKAAQLVNEFPATLEGNWERCVFFENNTRHCDIADSTTIKQIFEHKINQITYQKKFILNSDLQQSTIAVWLGTIDDVDEVKINGHLIGKTGQFPPYFQSGFRYQRLYLVPSVILKFNQFNNLEVRTFSSANQMGLNEQSIIIGDYFHFSHKLQEQDYLYIFCISILLLLTLFQFYYYFMVKGNDETLYLAMFLVSFAFVAFTRSQAPLHIGLDLSSTFKAEMFSLNLGVIGGTLFVFRFFELEIRRVYVLGVLLMSLPGIINMIHPNLVMARHLGEVSYWILCVFNFFIGGSALIIAFSKRKKYYLLIGIICALSWLLMVLDSASQSTLLFNWQQKMHPALLTLTATFLGISLTMIVTDKYWHRFKGATYDYLTGALLRPAFFQRLSQEIERSQKENALLLVAVIQIQEVKNISVNYGQGIGDNLVIAVSELITNFLDPFDLICYFDNDEFCIATTVESHEEAENNLKKLHRQLVETQQTISAETNFFVGAKIGAVIYNQDHHLSVSQLIQDANYGLEKAKLGKNKEYILLNNPSVIA